MKDKKVGAILLAAGNSSRFGANKLLYEIEGNPLVQYSMEIISQLPFEQKIVVTQYPQVEQGPYSGCGSQHCLDHRQPLSKQLLHSYIKKKTPCMVDIEEDQPIIYTTLWKKNKERRKNTR